MEGLVSSAIFFGLRFPVSNQEETFALCALAGV